MNIQVMFEVCVWSDLCRISVYFRALILHWWDYVSGVHLTEM